MSSLVSPEAAAEEVSEPLAKVHGQPYTLIPQDLYIPPDALEIFLEAFEGPLDLLLYLIKRQNIDICQLPITLITQQYMEYLDLMQQLQLELAAEYLVMAATLAEIKSRMLLPRPGGESDDDSDPRAELIRRLQEYERFKQAAEDLDSLPRQERDSFTASAKLPSLSQQRPQPQLELAELLSALQDVLDRAAHFGHHHVEREPLSVRERMSQILDELPSGQFTAFVALFRLEEGRLGVVVTFLATLELIRSALVELVQAEPFSPIYLRPRTHD